MLAATDDQTARPSSPQANCPTCHGRGWTLTTLTPTRLAAFDNMRDDLLARTVRTITECPCATP